MTHHNGDQIGGPNLVPPYIAELANENFDLLRDLAMGQVPSGSVDLVFGAQVPATLYPRDSVAYLQRTEEVMAELRNRVGAESVEEVEVGDDRFVTYWASEETVLGTPLFFTETLMRRSDPKTPIFRAVASLNMPQAYRVLLDKNYTARPRSNPVRVAPEPASEATKPVDRGQESSLRRLGLGVLERLMDAASIINPPRSR